MHHEIMTYAYPLKSMRVQEKLCNSIKIYPAVRGFKESILRSKGALVINKAKAVLTYAGEIPAEA